MKRNLGFGAILALSFVVLVSVTCVAPAIAESTKGLKVPATLTPGPPVVDPPLPPPDKVWSTNGGIIQIRGEQTDYDPITLTIGGDVYTDGYSSNFGNVVINLKTGWLISRGYAEWTFEGIGGFAGNLEMKLSIITGWYSIHGVLHGFGDFEGQTLMLSYAGPPFPALWTGYCLKG